VLGKWGGTLVVLLILAGMLGLNLDLSQRRTGESSSARFVPGQNEPSGSAGRSPASRPEEPNAQANSGRRPASFREYPIGEDVEENQMRIAAVWLPPIQMDGMTGPLSSSLIHIEADIHATEGNRNGFPRDEFVPYLTVRYTIVPFSEASKPSTSEPITGTMMPMMARDGWHYGASIEMPRAGRYKVTYAIDPPAAGRHSDPITGVAPWWKPFQVSFDWDYPGPPPP
jgi:periplasmic iron binding protein